MEVHRTCLMPLPPPGGCPTQPFHFTTKVVSICCCCCLLVGYLADLGLRSSPLCPLFWGLEEGLVPREQDERHSYEKCQYVEFKNRVAKMKELREEREGLRVN